MSTKKKTFQNEKQNLKPGSTDLSKMFVLINIGQGDNWGNLGKRIKICFTSSKENLLTLVKMVNIRINFFHFYNWYVIG